MNKKNLLKFLGIIYLLLASYSAHSLREMFDEYLFLFIIVICIFTDLGGYIFGKIFKGPKLTKISPNKTYSGVVGSFVLSVIASSIYSQYIFSLDDVEAFFFLIDIEKLNSSIFILIVLFISAVSQIGDLIISYFKRLAKIKDTGKLLPGHGGFLDRADGIIFAIPVSYILFNYLS